MPSLFYGGIMKIQLLTNVSCPEGSFKIGETVELSEKITSGLLSGGYATKIEEVKLEVATMEEIEEMEEIELNVETIDTPKNFKKKR